MIVNIMKIRKSRTFLKIERHQLLGQWRVSKQYLLLLQLYEIEAWTDLTKMSWINIAASMQEVNFHDFQEVTLSHVNYLSCTLQVVSQTSWSFIQRFLYDFSKQNTKVVVNAHSIKLKTIHFLVYNPLLEHQTKCPLIQRSNFGWTIDSCSFHRKKRKSKNIPSRWRYITKVKINKQAWSHVEN